MTTARAGSIDSGHSESRGPVGCPSVHGIRRSQSERPKVFGARVAAMRKEQTRRRTSLRSSAGAKPSEFLQLIKDWTWLECRLRTFTIGQRLSQLGEAHLFMTWASY